ncbi:MAG TPA: DoxX family membrane protein [Puia sp.]|nr:DoxX family membrane protein [Puia sp.]
MLKRMKSEPVAYLLARLPIAMSMLGHGLIRLTKIQAFSQEMSNEFSKSFLPDVLVVPFSFLLPYVELFIGILLLLGLFTRWAAIFGAVTMIVLIFGSSILEQWNNIFIQLIYGAYFALLFRYAGYDYYSLDRILHK